jgi:hypothetical protein
MIRRHPGCSRRRHHPLHGADRLSGDERPSPGELVHVDVTKIRSTRDGGGWSIGRGSGLVGRSQRNPGYDDVHTAVDDDGRLADSEILPTKAPNACRRRPPSRTAASRRRLEPFGRAHRAPSVPRRPQHQNTGSSDRTTNGTTARSKESTAPRQRVGLRQFFTSNDDRTHALCQTLLTTDTSPYWVSSQARGRRGRASGAKRRDGRRYGPQPPAD